MNGHEFADIVKLEADLWDAADNLRANSKLTAGEYCMPVLGVIFLRHAANRYNEALREIKADQAAGKMPKRALVSADFKKRRALMLPGAARYETLQALDKDKDLGAALTAAMEAIEDEFVSLKGHLPKDYARFENVLLEDLLRVFDSEILRKASGDVFGRINEYFLMKFAMQGAQDNGEFFTPPSLVQLLVNVIEPDHGIVFDPACGSGGMFVQSSHFIERRGEHAAHRMTFYGHEYKTSNIRLALMNLAVHALEGSIKEANTFYEDPHELFGKCDFVMANPPFNVDKVDAGNIKTDRRLPFGLPGVNKDKKISNGNYLWISYFHSYLNKTGRAGFVMSSQASSAGHGEAEVRRKLIQTGDVDVMISIRSNFFYTRTVPCELWHFDKGKPAERRDHVLMLDARNIYRKVSRKIYDFSPEQQQNLTAIVWLYRGQTDRFIALVQNYLDRTLTEAVAIKGKADAFREQYRILVKMVSAATGDGSAGRLALPESAKERDEAARDGFQALDSLNKRISRDWTRPNKPTLNAQKKRLAEFDTLAASCRDLIKDVDGVFKLSVRVVDEFDAVATDEDKKTLRDLRATIKQVDTHRRALVEQLKATAYFERQAHWLVSRFPDGKLVAVPGLVACVSRKEIEAADWSLTPGRYVGVAPPEEDEDFDFEQTITEIHEELAGLNAEAVDLAATIQKNLEDLGV